jgi:transposase
LLAFVATLGFSRATFVRFTRAEQFEDWRDGLVGAFEHFGGVPREVLFDNTKTVIIERDGYGPGLHRWHAGMLELARDYGFQLRVCRPYRARTKGKVERFNGYLKGGFLVPLAATLRAGGLQLDVDTANREVLHWLNEVANLFFNVVAKRYERGSMILTSNLPSRNGQPHWPTIKRSWRPFSIGCFTTRTSCRSPARVIA